MTKRAPFMLSQLRQAGRAGLQCRPGRLRFPLGVSNTHRDHTLKRWRHYAPLPPEQSEWPYYIRRMVLALGVFGVALYGLNHLIQDNFIVNWPVRVKANAKASLLASQRGDKKEALKYSRQAWLAAQAAEAEEFGDEPYLTISGIALMYSQNCLESGQPSQAVEAVMDAYNLMRKQKDRPLGELEKVRAIGLLFRAGELYESMGKDDRAEKCYTKAINLSSKWFKVTLDDKSGSTIEFPKISPSVVSWLFDSGKQEYLTPDPSALFVRLARLYSRQARLEDATPVFRQGIAMKLKSSLSSTGLERTESDCSAALLMVEFAELILRVHEEPEKPQPFTKEYQAAEGIVKSSIETSGRWKEASGQANQRSVICEEAAVAALLASGALYERVGKYDTAESFYAQVLCLPNGEHVTIARKEAEDGLVRLAEIRHAKEK